MTMDCWRPQNRSTMVLVFLGVFQMLLAACHSDSADGEGAFSSTDTIPESFQFDGILPDQSQQPGDLFAVEIDCQQALPCQWDAAGTALSVTINAVSNTTDGNGMVVSSTMSGSRSTSIGFVGSATIIDSTGEIHESVSTSVSESLPGDNAAGFSLFAAVDYPLVHEFVSVPGLTARYLSRLSMEIVESNRRISPVFLNLPLAGTPGHVTDCRFVLPCTWKDPGGDYQVTVALADPIGNNRLSVHFLVEVAFDSMVIMNPGSLALGDDGTQFDPKVHTLDGIEDYRSVEVLAVADSVLSGVQTYLRNHNSTATGLKRLELRIVLNNTLSGIYPVFNNIPFF